MSDGPEGQWLTYAELATMMGRTANAARMHAVRRRWPRRAPNRVGGPARVLVPASEVVRDRATHTVAPCDARPNGSVRPHDEAHVRAIEVLREQLVIANGRAERTERRIDEMLEERRRDVEERRRLLELIRGPAAVVAALVPGIAGTAGAGSHSPSRLPFSPPLRRPMAEAISLPSLLDGIGRLSTGRPFFNFLFLSSRFGASKPAEFLGF